MAPPAPISDIEAVREQATLFFAMIVAQDVKGLVDASTFPFHLETKALTAAPALTAAWSQALGAKDTTTLTLASVEVLTPSEMERKYGKPPARLSSLPLNRPGAFVAVASLSGRPAVAVFHKVGNGWKAAAFHD